MKWGKHKFTMLFTYTDDDKHLSFWGCVYCKTPWFPRKYLLPSCSRAPRQ
jgi:hypothetical protein